MDRSSSSPELHSVSPPQNTSTPARRRFSDGGSESDESLRDGESVELSEDDLDEFFKNAEGLSDQTFAERLYDCSLSTDVEKSLSHSNHPTLNECSTSNIRHFHDLSCSMLNDAEESLQSWKRKSEEIAFQLGMGTVAELDPEVVKGAKNELAEVLHSELLHVRQENEHLKILNRSLSSEVEEQRAALQQSSAAVKDFIPKVRTARENIEIANLSVSSLDHKNDCSPNTTTESFKLSSYVQNLDQDKRCAEINHENISCQTSPVPTQNENKVQNDKFISLYQDMFSFRSEWDKLEQMTKQELFERIKEMKQITSCVDQIIECYENEITSSKHQRLSDQKHYQEVINTLKDDIKTMKMRNQEMKKHKDQEIRELKSRLPQTDEKPESLLESIVVSNATDVHPTLDDSFSSCNSNMEETFTNLTRTKVEYLKLTPSEYLDDEVVDTVLSIPDGVRHILEDKDLKYRDLEKKFEANKRYLEDLTHDRELEREEFQQSSVELQIQIEELRKENIKFLEDKKQLMYQIEDLTNRLKNAEENGMDFVQKLDKSDHELKAAVEKIYELREIVRDQEIRMDEMTQNVAHLEEQRQALRDELEKQEMLNKREQPIYKEQDTFGALPLDVTDEIHHQLQDLARRIQFKVGEMDSFQLQTRPSSSCSGVTSAVSTEDISCRDVAGRISRSFENCTLEHMGSAILNEIHRLESHFDNLVRYDDVFVKKLKDAELQSFCQRTKIEELESQVSIYQEKCSKQMLTIADLEGKIDSLRFESSNQNVVSSLQSRLGAASKQIDDLRSLLANKEKELTQVKAEFNLFRAKQLEERVDKTEASCQTNPLFEESVDYPNLSYEGVSPEKIRRMDTVNPLNASIISLSRTLGKDSQAMSLEPEISVLGSFHEKGRTGNVASYGGDERYVNDSSSAGDVTIKEMDENLQQLQQLIQEKDKEIQNLNKKLAAANQQNDLLKEKIADSDKSYKKCEQEFVTIDTDLILNQSQHNNPPNTKGVVLQGHGPGSDGDNSVYEISYAADYEIDGDSLKYRGFKLLNQGPRTENIVDQGERRVLETDRQIEIATLNTHILQLKRALEEEKRKSEDLMKRLKICEEDKAKMRSHSPMTRAPLQNVVSSVSVHRTQQRELARQVEEGTKLLRERDKDIRALRSQITELETKLKGKSNHEQELTTRLQKTIAMLKRCEEHGRELTASNQEQIHEIRRLKTQLDRANVNHNNENCPQSGSGSEYFENFMRAKSHRKALAWQKKYLYSVVLGYKSILRLNDHGSVHPDLLQTQVPIAPGAVGYLDTRSPRTRLRVAALTIIAILRMKYMVSRWSKKRPGESSPDSEYKASRHSNRVDSSIIRPRRGILMHNRVNTAPPPPAVDNNVSTHESRRGNLGDISEYLSRFASLENEISSSLSRNIRPSNKP